MLAGFIFAGRPEEGARALRGAVALGLNGLIVNTAGPWTAEDVAAAAETLADI